ncbi:MAG: hypothetical protein J6T10_07235 [Methanobrevibacter sp.]|nr:hypothetical protein [Methanobrevibacter sp.]
MIDKNIFIKSMEEIEKAFLKDEKFNDALDEYNNDSYHCFLPSALLFEKGCVSFLTYSLGLDPKNDEDMELVFWFVYDCKFGKEKDQAVVSVTNKQKETKEYHLKDSGDFYDFVKDLVEDRKNGCNKEDNNKEDNKNSENKKRKFFIKKGDFKEDCYN